jgi:hypothetical protein
LTYEFKEGEQILSYMKFKGQSSIEYLSTYGWMLLVVAIVGGVFYTNYLPEEQCRQQVTSGMSNQLQIADMAVDSEGDLALLIRNMGAQPAKVKQIKATAGSNTTSLTTNVTLEPVEEQAFRLNDTASTESCNEIQVRFVFNSSEIGEVVDEGKLQGEFTVQ